MRRVRVKDLLDEKLKQFRPLFNDYSLLAKKNPNIYQELKDELEQNPVPFYEDDLKLLTRFQTRIENNIDDIEDDPANNDGIELSKIDTAVVHEIKTAFANIEKPKNRIEKFRKEIIEESRRKIIDKGFDPAYLPYIPENAENASVINSVISFIKNPALEVHIEDLNGLTIKVRESVRDFIDNVNVDYFNLYKQQQIKIIKDKIKAYDLENEFEKFGFPWFVLIEDAKGNEKRIEKLSNWVDIIYLRTLLPQEIRESHKKLLLSVGQEKVQELTKKIILSKEITYPQFLEQVHKFEINFKEDIEPLRRLLEFLKLREEILSNPKLKNFVINAKYADNFSAEALKNLLLADKITENICEELNKEELRGELFNDAHDKIQQILVFNKISSDAEKPLEIPKLPLRSNLGQRLIRSELELEAYRLLVNSLISHLANFSKFSKSLGLEIKKLLQTENQRILFNYIQNQNDQLVDFKDTNSLKNLYKQVNYTLAKNIGNFDHIIKTASLNLVVERYQQLSIANKTTLSTQIAAKVDVPLAKLFLQIKNLQIKTNQYIDQKNLDVDLAVIQQLLDEIEPYRRETVLTNVWNTGGFYLTPPTKPAIVPPEIVVYALDYDGSYAPTLTEPNQSPIEFVINQQHIDVRNDIAREMGRIAIAYDWRLSVNPEKMQRNAAFFTKIYEIAYQIKMNNRPIDDKDILILKLAAKLDKLVAEFSITNNAALFEKMNADIVAGKKVIVTSFSKRFTVEQNAFNRKQNLNGSSFLSFQMLVDKLNEGPMRGHAAEFCPLDLGDFLDDEHGLQPGMTAALVNTKKVDLSPEKIEKIKKINEAGKQHYSGKNKLPNAFVQMHYLRKKYPNQQITYQVHDDNQSILNSLETDLNNNKDLIPENTTVKLYPYDYAKKDKYTLNPDKSESHKQIIGTGKTISENNLYTAYHKLINTAERNEANGREITGFKINEFDPNAYYEQSEPTEGRLEIPKRTDLAALDDRLKPADNLFAFLNAAPIILPPALLDRNLNTDEFDRHIIASTRVMKVRYLKSIALSERKPPHESYYITNLKEPPDATIAEKKLLEFIRGNAEPNDLHEQLINPPFVTNEEFNNAYISIDRQLLTAYKLYWLKVLKNVLSPALKNLLKKVDVKADPELEIFCQLMSSPDNANEFDQALAIGQPTQKMSKTEFNQCHGKTRALIFTLYVNEIFKIISPLSAKQIDELKAKAKLVDANSEFLRTLCLDLKAPININDPVARKALEDKFKVNKNEINAVKYQAVVDYLKNDVLTILNRDRLEQLDIINWHVKKTNELSGSYKISQIIGMDFSYEIADVNVRDCANKILKILSIDPFPDSIHKFGKDIVVAYPAINEKDFQQAYNLVMKRMQGNIDYIRYIALRELQQQVIQYNKTSGRSMKDVIGKVALNSLANNSEKEIANEIVLLLLSEEKWPIKLSNILKFSINSSAFFNAYSLVKNTIAENYKKHLQENEEKDIRDKKEAFEQRKENLVNEYNEHRYNHLAEKEKLKHKFAKDHHLNIAIQDYEQNSIEDLDKLVMDLATQEDLDDFEQALADNREELSNIQMVAEKYNIWRGNINYDLQNELALTAKKSDLMQAINNNIHDIQAKLKATEIVEKFVVDDSKRVDVTIDDKLMHNNDDDDPESMETNIAEAGPVQVSQAYLAAQMISHVLRIDEIRYERINRDKTYQTINNDSQDDLQNKPNDPLTLSVKQVEHIARKMNPTKQVHLLFDENIKKKLDRVKNHGGHLYLRDEKSLFESLVYCATSMRNIRLKDVTLDPVNVGLSAGSPQPTRSVNFAGCTYLVDAFINLAVDYHNNPQNIPSFKAQIEAMQAVLINAYKISLAEVYRIGLANIPSNLAQQQTFTQQQKLLMPEAVTCAANMWKIIAHLHTLWRINQSLPADALKADMRPFLDMINSANHVALENALSKSNITHEEILGLMTVTIIDGRNHKVVLEKITPTHSFTPVAKEEMAAIKTFINNTPFCKTGYAPPAAPPALLNVP